MQERKRILSSENVQGGKFNVLEVIYVATYGL